MHFRFIVLSILVLTACTSHQNKSPTKQTLRLNLYCEPPTLDLRKATDSTSMNVLLNLYEGLTRIGTDNQPYPAIAEEIDVSEDGLTYTFKLRKTRWSNGDPITATDFYYSWRTSLDPLFPSPLSYKLYVIKNAAAIKEGTLPPEELGVEVKDEQTLIVTLEHPVPYFLELTAFPTFFPINHRKDLVDEEWAAEAGTLFTTNGPFLLKKWEHESEIQLAKNPLYWESEAVHLDEVQLLMIDDTTTEFYMFEMGEIDWAGSPLSNLPSEFLPALKKEGKLYSYPVSAVYYYKINTECFPFDNLKFRQALGRAINRQVIVDHILQAEQKPAMALVPSMPDWEESSFFSDGDGAGAKILFDEALEEMGITTQDLPVLSLCYNSNREHQKVAQAIQQQWKEILGLRVELETYDWKVYLAKMSQQNYQIGRMGWLGDFTDPISFLTPFKVRDNARTGGENQTGWEHPHYKSLLDEVATTTDPHKRASLLRQAEELLISEMPVIPLFYITYCYLKNPAVEDVYLSPLGMMDFKEARLHP